MRFLTILAALGALSLTASAESGWRDLNGQVVPEVSAKEWLNTGKYEPTTADLRGKVYLIEFFATW